jgi:hypothetical protein
MLPLFKRGVEEAPMDPATTLRFAQDDGVAGCCQIDSLLPKKAKDFMLKNT